ncbi:MAG: hypothetical protein HY720_24835 [Planctomycetes bacterium]|nr:hypothetical protein [Planctomycetota bacterium]
MARGSRDERYRSSDFLIWVGSIVLLLLVYFAVDWGLAWRSRGSSGGEENPKRAVPEEIDIWWAEGSDGVSWLLAPVHGDPERDGFERHTLNRMLRLGENALDFRALWIYRFGGEGNIMVDRSRTRVVLGEQGTERGEVSVAAHVTKGGEDVPAYAPVTLALFLGPLTAGSAAAGPVVIPPQACRELLVAFEGEVEDSAVESVRLVRDAGGDLALQRIRIPAMELSTFLARPRRDEFPPGSDRK